MKVETSKVKICKTCKKEKCLTRYHKDSRAKDGRYGYCKKCVSLRKKKFWLENKDRILEKWQAERDLLKKLKGDMT